MAIIKKEDYTFNVDIEKTKEYYNSKYLCDCNECQNYYRQVKSRFPIIEMFLEQFGIDISRPDEICSTFDKGEVDYHAVSYTVVGECVELGKYEFDINDGGLFLSIVINKNPVYPNEQEERLCFEMVIYGIRLPWVLETPHEETVKITLWEKIKSIFHKG